MNVPEFIANNVNLEETLTESSAKFHKGCLNKLSRLIQKGKRPFEEPTHARLEDAV